MRVIIRCGRDPRLLVASAQTMQDAIRELHAGPIGETASSGQARIAVVARDDTEEEYLIRALMIQKNPEKLDDERVFSGLGADGGVVFMFPGQGSQYSGMFGGLRVALPTFDRRVTALADAHPVAAAALSKIGADRRPAADEQIARTEYAQPALALICSALTAELARFGVRPDLLIGHSFGELVALAVAGSLTTEALVALSVARGAAMARAARESPGQMLAVHGEIGPVLTRLAELGVNAELAAINAADQMVLAGPNHDISAARASLNQSGIRSSMLRTSAAFHSSLMTPARDEFAAALASTNFAPFAARTVGSNVTGGWHPGDAASARDLLTAQLTTPVHWAENFRNALTAGGRIFVEVGPGKTLSALCQASSPDDGQRIISFSVDRGRNAADLAWLQGLARLAVHGVPVRDPFARVPERIHLQSNGDSLPPAGTGIGSSADATSQSLPVHYLWEAGRQVEAYFQQEDRLMGAGSDPATIRLALQLNSSVVTSFLKNGAHAVRASEAFPREPEVPSLGNAARPLPAAADGTAGTDGSTEAGDSDALAMVTDALASLTGFLAEEITPDMRLEDDLGIVSIALLEVLVKMGILSADRPDTSILMDIATVRDMAAFLERAADDRPAPGDPAAAQSEGPLPAAGRMAVAPAEPVHRFGFARQPVRCEGDVPAAALVVSADPQTADQIRQGLAAGGCAVTVWLADGNIFVADGHRYPADSPSMSDAVAKVLSSGPVTVLFATGQNSGTSARVEASGLALSSLARAVSAHRVGQHGVRIGVLVAPGSAPEAVMAIGYARALQKEWPDTPVRAIRQEGPAGAPLDAAGLAAALSNGPSDTHLVRDAAGRYWREVHLPMPIRRTSQRRTGDPGRGAVLATGGGDGITAEVIVAIAERYRCPVAVLGRTGFPADGDSGRAAAIRRTSERVGAIDGAEFMYCQADVTDAGQVRTAVQRVRDRFGAVRGVILGAGVMTEGRIEITTAETETQTLNTKVEQARIFREIFQDDDLEFALLFSSIASYAGNVAQAGYVAANLAFEELGAEWNRASSYPVRSVLWSIWDETGLAPSWLRRTMRETGIQGIKNSVGSELLLDELGSLHDPPDRILLAPESVLNYLTAAKASD